MNIEKHLIFVKDEDKTEQIKYCKYEGSKCKVTYDNSSEYSYNRSNVVWHKVLKEVDVHTSVVYENNQPLSGVVKILDFGE